MLRFVDVKLDVVLVRLHGFKVRVELSVDVVKELYGERSRHLKTPFCGDFSAHTYQGRRSLS